MTAPPIVVLHDKDGTIHYLVPPGSTLLTIDESCTADRVYRHGVNTTMAYIAALIGDSPIGHDGDEYLSGHEAQAILAALWHADGGEFRVVPVGPVEDE